MKEKVSISDSELEVMNVLWKNGKSMRIQEVMDGLQDSNRKYNTVGTLLLRLGEKGAVASEKVNGTIYYSAVLEKDEYAKRQTGKFVEQFFDGSAKELTVALFRNGQISKEDIEEIRQMFDL